MKIKLVYSLGHNGAKQCKIIDYWPSTSAAVSYAISLGAVCAVAKVIKE